MSPVAIFAINAEHQMTAINITMANQNGFVFLNSELAANHRCTIPQIRQFSNMGPIK